jgi:hypothetical protein
MAVSAVVALASTGPAVAAGLSVYTNVFYHSFCR